MHRSFNYSSITWSATKPCTWVTCLACRSTPYSCREISLEKTPLVVCLWVDFCKVFFNRCPCDCCQVARSTRCCSVCFIRVFGLAGPQTKIEVLIISFSSTSESCKLTYNSCKRVSLSQQMMQSFYIYSPVTLWLACYTWWYETVPAVFL